MPGTNALNAPATDAMNATTARGTEAPADYEELFKQYFGMVRALVRKFGVQDDEDAAAEILLKFYERDFLAKYNASATFTLPNGKVKTTKFSTFLSGFVAKYVLQCRDRQMTRMRKEPIRLETPIDESTTWADLFVAPTHASPLDQVEYVALIQDTHKRLAELPVRGTRDLARVFRICIEQMTLDGKIDRKAIAKSFGISDTAVCLIFKDLRDALAAMGVTAHGEVA